MWWQNELMSNYKWRVVYFASQNLFYRSTSSKHLAKFFKYLEQIKNNWGSLPAKNEKQRVYDENDCFLLKKVSKIFRCVKSK